MRWHALLGFFSIIAMGLGLGCDGDSSPKPSTQQTKLQSGEALMAPSRSPGRMENNEGVAHYAEGRWDMAEIHFRKSLEMDPGLAEGHFNLGLALDKEGKHQEATEAFSQALQLAPENTAISSSSILQAHVK